MVFQIWFNLDFSSSESISSKARGLIRILREIFISSSTCSLDLDISLRASMAGACEDLPPFSFWAAIICFLLAKFLLLSSLLQGKFFLLFNSDFLPLGLLLLQPLEFLLLL